MAIYPVTQYPRRPGQASQIIGKLEAAEVVADTSYGWHAPLSRATLRSMVPLATSAFIGLVDVAVPTPAVAFSLSSPSFARSFYYQAQTQVLAPAAPVVEVNLGWLQPLSVALQRADAPRTPAATLVVPPFETPRGWFQAFSGAPPPLPVALGLSVVPLTPQAVAAVTPPFLAVQQNVAPQMRGAPVQNTTCFGLVEVQTSTTAQNAATSYVPVSARSFYYQAQTQVFPPVEAAAETPPYWITQQNVAPQRRGVPQQTTSFIGLVEVQTATPTVAFSVSSPTFARPFYYQSKTSVLPPIAAPVVEVNYGWQQPASLAPPPAQLIQPELRPFAVQQAAVAPEGWQRPLSVAVPVPPARQGSAFVPFNTAQAAPAATPPFWIAQQNSAPQRRGTPQQTTSFIGLVEVEVPVTTPTVAFNVSSPIFARPFYYQSSTTGLPPVAAPDNTGTVATWAQGLSQARPIPLPAPQGYSAVPYNTAQVVYSPTAGWYQPLSVAVPIPQAAIGSTFTPLDTVQTPAPPATGEHHSMPFFATPGQLKSW